MTKAGSLLRHARACGHTPLRRYVGACSLGFNEFQSQPAMLACTRRSGNWAGATHHRGRHPNRGCPGAASKGFRPCAGSGPFPSSRMPPGRVWRRGGRRLNAVSWSGPLRAGPAVAGGGHDARDLYLPPCPPPRQLDMVDAATTPLHETGLLLRPSTAPAFSQTVALKTSIRRAAIRWIPVF